MIDKLLSQLRIRRSVSGKKKAGVDHILPADLLGAPTNQNLDLPETQSVSQTSSPPHRTPTPKAFVSWQLPLPYDVMFEITHAYLLDLPPTLHSLSRACRSLAELCRPLKLQTIILNTRSRKSPTSCQKLAAFLKESPEVVNYVRNLRILDHGKMFQGSRPLTVEEDHLCYILTRPYRNMTRLELSLHVVWTLLPLEVQNAFGRTLSLPSLRSISLEHVRIPVDLLSYVQFLTSLEIRCEVSLPCKNDTYPNTYCAPTTLIYHDPSHFGFTSEHIFLGVSLHLSNLEHLEVYAPVRHLKFLRNPFKICYRTLTTLKIYPLKWNESSRGPMDLKILTHLKSLTLYADISGVTYMDDTLQGVARTGFWWLLDTLRKCHQPSIESLELVIQTKDLAHTRKCPWKEVERVLSLRMGWHLLKDLHIRHNGRGLEEGNRWYKDGFVDAIILPQMPVLARTISIRFSISTDCLPEGRRWNDYPYLAPG